MASGGTANCLPNGGGACVADAGLLLEGAATDGRRLKGEGGGSLGSIAEGCLASLPALMNPSLVAPSVLVPSFPTTVFCGRAGVRPTGLDSVKNTIMAGVPWPM